MASRRMKLKATVNIGRTIGNRGNNPIGTSENENKIENVPNVTASHLIEAINSNEDGSLNTINVENSVSDEMEHNTEKHRNNSSSSIPSSEQTVPNVNMPVEIDDCHVFDEHEVEGLELVPFSSNEIDEKQSRKDVVGVTSGRRSVSPIKAILPQKDQSKRFPGAGPPSTNAIASSILNNIQKEIGHVHAANVLSTETLRQRLHKGTNSTKYSALRKEFLNVQKNQKVEKKDMTILHFTFWNPPKEDPALEEEDNIHPEINTSGIDVVEELETSEVDVAEENPDNDVVKKSSGPRVKVGPDGELIIDEQSLVIETSESVRARKQLSEMETIVSEGPSRYFSNKSIPRRGYDWSVKETVRFFKALTICGTDFSMMAHLFPKRTRSELKAKFKREDRKNSSLVSQALAAQIFDPMEPLTDTDESDDDSLPKQKRRSSDLVAENSEDERISPCIDPAFEGNSSKSINKLKRTKQHDEINIEDIDHPQTVGFTKSSESLECSENSSPKIKKNRKNLVKTKRVKFKMGRPVTFGQLDKSISINEESGVKRRKGRKMKSELNNSELPEIESIESREEFQMFDSAASFGTKLRSIPSESSFIDDTNENVMESLKRQQSKEERINESISRVINHLDKVTSENVVEVKKMRRSKIINAKIHQNFSDGSQIEVSDESPILTGCDEIESEISSL